MPVYDYQCAACDETVEIHHKISEKPHVRCPECKKKCKRVISTSSFVLKGRGWAADGYANP